MLRLFSEMQSRFILKLIINKAVKSAKSAKSAKSEGGARVAVGWRCFLGSALDEQCRAAVAGLGRVLLVEEAVDEGVRRGGILVSRGRRVLRTQQHRYVFLHREVILLREWQA